MLDLRDTTFCLCACTCVSVCARAHTCISMISFYVYARISIHALSLHYFFSPISDLVLPSFPLSSLSLPFLPPSLSPSPSLPPSLLPFSSIYPFLYLSVKITITNYETFGMCNTHAPTHRHTTHSRARTHTLPSIS